MYSISRKIFVLFMLSSLLFAGCTPPNKNTVADTWITNIGKVNFMQEGDKVTGAIEGYGGQWHETFEGTLTNNQAAFSTEWFGDFTLVFNGDTFKNSSPDLAFCGIRSSKANELPAGCGFSGKWIVPAKVGFTDGSYIELKQAAENVTGTFYDGNGDVYDTISGTVYWGKGWMMDGTTEKHGKIQLDINAVETGFMITTTDFSYDDQLCAAREGQTKPYLGFYFCE
jgi:hypothetical protein